jgi:hypothetical protein
LELGLSFLGGAALLAAGVVGLALAQVNCEMFPAGPAPTDCYIGLNRINSQKSAISAGVAQEQAGAATYRKVPGKLPNKKRRRASSR